MISVLVGMVIGALAVMLVLGWQHRPRRSPAQVEMCCRCNATIVGRQIHTVVDHPSDDLDIMDGLIMGSGTGVSADFCSACCPGGCSNRRHAKLVM